MEPIWSKTLARTRLRNRLYDRLAHALQDQGEVLVGLPFRPLEHREVWIADVGFLAAPRALFKTCWSGWRRYSRTIATGRPRQYA